MVGRRALVVVAAAALPALAAATAPVAAEEMADLDAAVLSGTASAPGVLVVGGPPGIFTFNSSVCVMASASGPGGEAGESSPDVEAPDLSCSATATGSYFNVVCGTGLVFGTGSLSEGASSDTYTVTEFSIVFVSGVGVLSGVVTESDADGGGTAGAQPLYGTVLLEPQVLLDTSHCADQFTANVVLETTA